MILLIPGCINKKINNEIINEIVYQTIVSILEIECEFCKENVYNIIKSLEGVKDIEFISIDFEDKTIIKITHNSDFNINSLKKNLEDEGFILKEYKDIKIY